MNAWFLYTSSILSFAFVINEYGNILLSLFCPLFFFDLPENIKNLGFHMFSGGSERKHW